MRRLFTIHGSCMRRFILPRLKAAHQATSTLHTARNHGTLQSRTSADFIPLKAITHGSNGLETELWFTSSLPVASPERDYKPVDERKLKLGKTIRILRQRLPTLLATPLPQELLSPQITLRLFPSTHPHLPSVSGRIAYTAALWTSPVAWGRVPVVGNVKLIILSERMVSTGTCSNEGEKLIVRWKTCGAGKGDVTEQIKKMMAILGRSKSPATGADFHGLFLFEFDEKGRISKHTIEHVEEGNQWEQTARVISVTDWLLGRAWRKNEQEPEMAMCRSERSERLR